MKGLNIQDQEEKLAVYASGNKCKEMLKILTMLRERYFEQLKKQPCGT